MFAVKLKGKITRDHQLQVELPEDIAPGTVEVIVLHETPAKPAKTTKKPRRRAGRKVTHPAFGIWANRTDISDSGEFAAHLREQMESRRDRRG